MVTRGAFEEVRSGGPHCPGTYLAGGYRCGRGIRRRSGRPGPSSTPTVPIRSKVGAGDSTVAGIVLGLARGLDLNDAVRFGVAAGAAAVMTPGSELCRRDDTERMYDRIRGGKVNG
jgi:sugar/nucleoside kinase (ribokinase family)